MQEVVNALILDYAGVSELAFRTGANAVVDRNALARSAGILDGVNYVPGNLCSPADFALMLENTKPLYDAMRKVPMEPFFVNGMAQPIFPYGNSGSLGITTLDTTGEGIARFVVWVETDYDTDGDGKLDLIKVLVQLPRAAVDKGMKVGTVYEAQPYNEGTIGGTDHPTNIRTPGQNYLNENGPFHHELLHGVAAPRVPVGEKTTAEMVAEASFHCGRVNMSHANRCDCPWTRWSYQWTASAKDSPVTVEWGRPAGNQMGGRQRYDYFLVRGFAHVTTAGLATLEGDGMSTYGADIEIAAYAKVIEWLNGNAKAYASKDCNIEVKADWSNGLAGMTGVSYGGSTPVGVATTGVEGLAAIIPQNGVISYYEYQNAQGGQNWTAQYTPGLAGYILSAMGRPDWAGSAYRSRQLGYMQQMFLEAVELNGQYGEHWARRDYTRDGWDGFGKGWGPSKIQAAMLIVSGGNDPNVMPKQAVLMYEAAKKGNGDFRHLWNQGHHMSLNNHMVGEYSFQDVTNLWFSRYLFEHDNGVLDILPPVYAQSNKTGEFVEYGHWGDGGTFVMDNKNIGRASFTPLNLVTAPSSGNVPYMFGSSMFGGNLNSGDEDYSTFPVPVIFEDEFQPIVSADAPITITPANELDPTRFHLINSANGGTAWATQLNGQTAGSTLWSTVLTEDITIQGVTKFNFRAAIMSAGTNVLSNAPTVANQGSPVGQARVFARLVEVAAPGTTIRAFGTNVSGATISTTTIQTGGIYNGGGLAPSNLVRFTQATNLTHREIARGFMNLANPHSGWDSYLSTYEDRIDIGANIGVFHDYTLYLQPSVHKATAGNMLVLILSTGHWAGSTIDGNRNYTGVNAFTFSVDTEVSNVVIPLAVPAHRVTFTDWDGMVLASRWVSDGEAALPPAEDPVKKDWIFTGWDKDISEVYESMTVTAQFDPTILNLLPSAVVTKLNGNQNDLTITVIETWSDGAIIPITVTLKINNNAAGTYTVGSHRVYVDTKGNTQIREIRVVS